MGEISGIFLIFVEYFITMETIDENFVVLNWDNNCNGNSMDDIKDNGNNNNNNNNHRGIGNDDVQ